MVSMVSMAGVAGGVPTHALKQLGRGKDEETSLFDRLLFHH